MKKSVAQAVITACAAAIAGTAFTLMPGAASAIVHHDGDPMTAAGPFQHIYYIMMENEGTAQLVGNPYTPYINSLVRNFGYDDHYFGVTHESFVNYIAAVTGNNWGSNTDDPTQTFDHTSLIDQLVARGIRWKAYMQSLPSPGFKGYWYPDNLPAKTSPGKTPPNALYAIKHDPFMAISSIANTGQAQNVVPFGQFATDLQDNHVPNFVWISPDLIHDMHGQPPGTGATVTYNDPNKLFRTGDNFLRSTVQEIMSSRSWRTSKSVIFINWDEAEYPEGNVTPAQVATFTQPGPDAPVLPAGQVDGYDFAGGAYGGGKVPLLIIDSAAKGPFTIHTWANHYNLLRTIEQNWGLGYLGNASDAAQVKTLPIPGMTLKSVG